MTDDTTTRAEALAGIPGEASPEGSGLRSDLAGIGAGLSREERETIILLPERGDVEVSTSSPALARKLARICEALGLPLVVHSAWCVRATLPRSALRLRVPPAPRAPQLLSDEERARRAERFPVVRAARARALLAELEPEESREHVHR